jgi:hypothetical protein
MQPHAPKRHLGRKTLIPVITVLALTACSIITPQKQFDTVTVFASVRTIEMKDATDPVLLVSTSAKRVREYLEIGLRARGYTICSDCQSDAVATVTVTSYGTNPEFLRDFPWVVGHYVEYAQSVWTVSVVRDGETIFQKRISHNKAMPIDQLAGRQVQDVVEQIPARKTNP